MRTLTFTLSHVPTGIGLGVALICAEAHYASIAWRDIDQLDRKWVTPDEWRAFESTLGDHFSPGPLESGHLVVRMLVPVSLRQSIIVQYLADRPLEATKPTGVPELLDSDLRSQIAGRFPSGASSRSIS
jgi:hypothetical protein